MAYTLEKARILVVDDMKPVLQLATSVLQIYGFQDVLTAENGEDAFEMVVKHDPDLIITDWMMEPMNGLEFTQKVRTDPLAPNPYVPILMMTGFSSRLRVESARDFGITEFLVKPFTSRDLYVRIAQIIEKPRQFVDAGEFFGPDRRRKDPSGYEGPRKRGEDKEQKTSQEQKQAADILKKLRKEAKDIS